MLTTRTAARTVLRRAEKRGFGPTALHQAQPGASKRRRYSVLLTWDGGEAWMPVEGRLHRKLEVGSSVQLQLRRQRAVTLLGDGRTALVAGPITALDDAPRP